MLNYFLHGFKRRKSLWVSCWLMAVLTPLAVVAGPTSNSYYERIAEVIFKQPYPILPQYKVDSELFGTKGDHEDNHLLHAAIRTLNDNADLFRFPDGQKLFQPNGICFSGIWSVEHESEFSGLFSYPNKIPVIVRGSVMLDGTLASDQRAFGLAIKLFPLHAEKAESTLNLFVMESMGGRKITHVANAVLDNHPGFGRLPPLTRIGTLLRIRKDLTRAAKLSGSVKPNVRYSSLNHLARFGEADPITVQTPRWIKMWVEKSTPRVKAADFRNELAVTKYPHNELVYQLSVAADNNNVKANANWQSLGTLRLTRSITSLACDTQLHFQHASSE